MANTKKDLKSAAATGAGVMDAIAAGTATQRDKGRYRFSLVLPEELRPYLERAAYNASEPGHLVSINQYINDLILLDREKGGLNKYHEGTAHYGGE